MADALCGPSNPLQQFQKQSQLDRTLQQDRLTSRHTPAQGFRSQDPRAGLLDTEFEAFQAGVPPAELSHFQPQPPSFGGPSQAPSWATDFQRMNISSPPPAFQQQQFAQSTPASSNWANGFQQHIAQSAPRMQTSSQSPQQFQHMARYGGLSGFQSNFAQPSFASNLQSAKGKEVVTEEFDEAAFARAFDQAGADMLAHTDDVDMQEAAYQNGASTGGNYAEYLERLTGEAANALRDREGQIDQVSSGLRVTKEDTHSETLALIEQLKQQREQGQQNQQDLDSQISQDMNEVHSQYQNGNHALQDFQLQLMLLEQQNKKRLLAQRQEKDEPVLRDYAQEMMQARQREKEEWERQEEQKQQQDDDALAATARELLDKVEHNQSDKFKNSQFLGLMRKLRDREMKVEGDNMVETNVDAATTSDAQRLNSTISPTTANTLPLFDNSEQVPYPYPTQGIHPLDTRPPDYGIPVNEQDLDSGRTIDPRDGQEVVDVLRQGPSPDDIDSYDPSPAEYYFNPAAFSLYRPWTHQSPSHMSS